MKRFLLTGLALVVTLLAGAVSYFYVSHDMGQTLGPQPGTPAPDVSFVDLEGKTHRTADYRKSGDKPGKVVVLSFWSPTCPTGKQNMDAFADLARWCRENQVQFFAVDSYGDTAEKAAALVKEHGVDYPVVMDESTAAARALGAKTVTITYVLDPEGRIRYRGALTNRKSGADRVLYASLAAKEILDGKEVTVTKAAPLG